MKQIPLLFENDFCLVFNKPAGLAVQGGKGIAVSMDSILAETYKTRPLLVHRLDRDTSGVILAAKNQTAAAAFSAVFTLRKPGLAKQYIAVTSGIPEPAKGFIKMDLEIKGKMKTAETAYRLLGSGLINTGPKVSGNDPGISFSVLELELGTGRMHQIRRHLMFIKNPILGDEKYGDFSLNRELRKTVGLRRLLLHASRLVIPPSPLIPEGLDICAPIPDYFDPFLDKANAAKKDPRNL